MIVKIDSTSNQIYKSIKKLATHSGRKKSGLFVLEGLRSVNDAVKNNADIQYVVFCEDTPQIEFKKPIKTYVFSKKLFNELKFTVNSQGVLAVVKYSVYTCDYLFNSPDFEQMSKIVYLDGVQDPGNLGTIVRTCDAMGVDALILGDGCADLYNPKTIRSTMSSIFNLPVYFDNDTNETFEKFKMSSYKITGTFLDADKYIYDADLTGKCVIVMGNEANGISRSIEQMCNNKVKIYMKGKAESLNVATACAVVLYEQLRQSTMIE